jgi:hypothetical protein
MLMTEDGQPSIWDFIIDYRVGDCGMEDARLSMTFNMEWDR